MGGVARLTRLRWALSSLGAKPNGRESLDLLIDAEDLPGDGWRVTDERTWKTGHVEPSAAWSAAARDHGSVTAWRSFEQPSTGRWIWAEVVPLASSSDAQEALTALPTLLLKNTRADVTVVAEKALPLPEIPSATVGWAHAQETDSRRGPGDAFYLAASVDGVIAVTCASGLRDVWTFADVVAAVTRQCRRIATN